MGYTNAGFVLPDALIREIQRYVNGTSLYIPQVKRKARGEQRHGAFRAVLPLREEHLPDTEPNEKLIRMGEVHRISLICFLTEK